MLNLFQHLISKVQLCVAMYGGMPNLFRYDFSYLLFFMCSYLRIIISD